MAQRKAGNNKVGVGNITDVSGKVNIAAGDIIKTSIRSINAR
jgi:hypothetical protein